MSNISKFKSFFCRYKLWIAAITIVLFFIWEMTCLDVFKNQDNGIDRLHVYLIISLTFGIVAVAWTQLSGIKRVAEDDFLLRFDKRYCNRESLKGKTILHKIYSEAIYNPQSGEAEYDPRGEKHFTKMGRKIREMSKNKEKKDEIYENFIILINFLDTLETIAYFADKNEIDTKEIEEFLGNSVIYYYLIFIEWIFYNRRKSHDDDSYYEALEKLVEKLSKFNDCNSGNCSKKKGLQRTAANKLNELKILKGTDKFDLDKYRESNFEDRKSKLEEFKNPNYKQKVCNNCKDKASK